MAWRLFSTKTNDPDDAIMVVCMKTPFLTDLREMGLAAQEAVDLLMAVIAEDLGGVG